MSRFVKTELDGAVAVVTIENPPMNQLSAPLLDELEAEIDRLDEDDGVRAIVLQGAGERAFVAGADIKEFPSLRQAAAEAHETGSARGIQKLGHRMDAARKPFIAAIHGFCLGGGLELAMCCDLRIVSEDAQLGQPEIKLGLIPGGGGTQRLPRLVGIGRASSSTPGPPTTGASSRRSCRARTSVMWRLGSHARSQRAPPSRSGSSASSRARRATSRSRKG